MGNDDTLREHGERLAAIETWKKGVDNQKLDNRVRILELWKNTILGVIIFGGWMLTTVGREIIGLLSK